jgi:hypothetical protein
MGKKSTNAGTGVAVVVLGGPGRIPVNRVQPRATVTEVFANIAVVVVGGQFQSSVTAPVQSFSVSVAERASIASVFGGQCTVTGSSAGQMPASRSPLLPLPPGNDMDAPPLLVVVGSGKELDPGPGPHGPVMFGHVSGDPIPIEGQGGSMRPVVVTRPSPPVKGTVAGGRSMLGLGMNVALAAWPLVTFTLPIDISVVVIAVTVIVTVTTHPGPSIVVGYGAIEMVVLLPEGSVLGGSTMMQGGGQ